MEFDNIETIKQAVEIGAGVSILPEPTVRDELQQRLVGGRAPDRPGVAAADRHHSSPAQGVHAHGGKFVELLQQVQEPRRRRKH